MSKNKITNRQIIIALHFCLILIVLYFFWTQSRYPALDNKMFMGTRNTLTGISFDRIISTSHDSTFLFKVYAGTINWYFTNWKGMTFGLIFSALVLSLFSFINLPQIKNRWLRTFLGVLVGAPLGVCANCATPISYGFGAIGLASESVIAITLSSPTLNIVILSILFKSFPTNLILVKLVSSLLLIFILVPIFLIKEKVNVENEYKCSNETEVKVKDILKSLCFSSLFILKRTFPLMLLSGVLGSILFELVNFDWLLGTDFSWLKLTITSLIGTLLPVPMAFDVILSEKLLSSSINISYIASLLCTLGIFSIYPYLVFAKKFTIKLASLIVASVFILGIMSGGLLNYFQANSFSKLQIVSFKKNPKEFIHKNIQLICNKHPGRNNCQNSEYDKLSQELNSVNLCEFINDLSWKKKCFEKAQYRSFGLDYENCSKNLEKSICIEYLARILKTSNLNQRLPCEVSGNKNDSLCIDLRKFYLSNRLLKKNDCSSIENLLIKDACYYRVSVAQARSKKRKNSSIHEDEVQCEKIQESKVKNECFSDVAFNTGEKKWCLSIPITELEHKRCVTNAILLYYSKQDDYSIKRCDEIQKEKTKSYCKDEFDLFENRKQLKFISSFSDFSNLSINKENQNEVDVDFTKTFEIPKLMKQKIFEDNEFILEAIPFLKKNKIGDLAFTKMSGNNLGLKTPQIFLEDIDSFYKGYGLSVGDINNDYWQDVIAGSFQDLNLYVNLGGHFQKIPILFKEKLYKNYQILISPINLAFVDFNNDGWLDLFISNYDGNKIIVLNDKNYFRDPSFILLPKKYNNFAISAGFGDLDGNGFVDLFLGNGPSDSRFNKQGGKTSFESNSNEIYYNQNGKFANEVLQDNYGITLSTLISDINNDGIQDVLVGNDFEVSDKIYLGMGNKKFIDLLPSFNLVPQTSNSTMSYDSADIDNDLKLEIYSVDMTRAKIIDTNYCSQLNGEDAKLCNKLFELGDKIIDSNFKACDGIFENTLKLSCMSKAISYMATQQYKKEICNLIPHNLFVDKYRCEQFFSKENIININKKNELPTISRNVLLKLGNDGKYKDVTEKFNVTSTHWGWNTKFVDLDNDGWQDIYAANGKFKHSEIASNVFFHNIKGKIFKNETENFGLTDFIDTASFVNVDFDFDGNIDIISQGYLSPLRVFKNNNLKNHSLAFSLNDFLGNRSGIGAKVFVEYVENGIRKKMMKELKASGGYSSFDPLIVHFGLGSVDKIISCEVRWTTGKPTILRKELSADNHYIITRK